MTSLPPGMTAMQVLKEKHDEITKMNLNLGISTKPLETIANTINSIINPPPTMPSTAPPAVVTTVAQQQPPLPKKTYKRMPKNTVSNS